MNQSPDHQPLRPPRRPPLGQDDRGRLLRGRSRPARRLARRCRRATMPRARRPAPLRVVRLRAGLPRRVGGGRRDPLGGHAALPQLRVGRHRRLRAGPRRALRRGARPRHRGPRPRPQAPDARQHGGGDRALRQRARGQTTSSPRTSRPGTGRSHPSRPRQRPSDPRRHRAPSLRKARQLRLRLLDDRRAPAARDSSSAPVAAIRVADRLGRRRVAARRSSARRSAVALAREDERQRDRAVEQVGAAVLARALGGAGDVEDVVEQLERQADPAAERAERRRGRAPATQRAELARRLEQRARSSARSAAGSARRARRRPRRPRAGAARPRASAELARESARICSGVAVQRELRERAREQQVAGRRRHPAPGGRDRPSAGRGAARRRRGRRRARASRSGRARPTAAARTSVVVGRPSPAARRTSSGRSRLPPAAIVAPACVAEHGAVAAGRPPRAAPRRAPAARGTCGAAGLDDRARRRRQATCVTRASSRAWMAMIPPAVRIQPTSRSPARPSIAAERRARREALDRGRQVLVGVGVAGDAARAAARPGRTTARRTSTAAASSAS